MSGRDPLPPKRMENDFTLTGYRPRQRNTCAKPTHLAQTEEPWSRLYVTPTVASIQRGNDPEHQLQAQNDSLDFQLSSVYDHHKHSFWRKNQMLYQDNVSEHKRRQEEQKMLENEKENDIRVWVDPQRRSVFSIK